jgi:hypothetical protein
MSTPTLLCVQGRLVSTISREELESLYHMVNAPWCLTLGLPPPPAAAAAAASAAATA